MPNTLKSGLIPVDAGTYKQNNQINDNIVGKFLSLIGIKKFYNPGIGLSLSSPNSGTTTTIVNVTRNVQGSLQPGANQLTYIVRLDNTISTDLQILMYVNFNYANGGGTGSGQNTVTIPAGSTFGSFTFSFNYTDQLINIQPIIINIIGVNFTINQIDASKASFTSTQTITKTISSIFNNNLNIPQFNISSINFYGPGRDTLILNGNQLN